MPGTLTLRNSRLMRYTAAVVAVGVGLLVRLAVEAWLEPGLPTYITYYPAVMIVALVGGLGPGLLATAVAAAAADYWVIPPVGGFGIERPVDAVGLVIFVAMGVFMSLVAEYLRRAQRKAAAFDREQALHETRRQNEFLANVLERSSQPFAIGYPDGRLGLFNRAFEELTGYTAEELRSKDWSTKLTPPEWRELERQKLEELHLTGQPVRYEKEYLRKDGSRVPIELLVHLVREAAGNPEYYYSFLTDLSARKEATAELRSTAEQRRLALEAADLGAWDYHFQTGDVSWDERCREMWGIPKADHIDYSAAIGRIHPEDRSGVDVAVQEALAGRNDGGYHREFRVVWPDGSVHWIASHGRVYFEGEGDQRHPIRFIGTNREITADKAAREALRESRERLAAFAAASFEGIILSDHGRIMDCNEQFAQMVGGTRQEVIGGTIAQFVPPEDHQRVMENIRARRESIVEHQMLRRDGSRIMVEAHGRPGDPSSGSLRHTAVRDITGRKRREEQLQRLNRTLKALMESSQAMLRAASETEYLSDVCKIITGDCGYAMVWIGFAEHDQEKSVRPVAYAGFEEGYLETLNLTWADTERGRGPTGTAIRTGKTCACANFLTDPSFAPWRQEAVRRGYAASLVVPLLAEGKAFGAITLYSKQPDPFTEDEVKLLTQLGDDVSYCIGTLRMRAAKAQADLERERAQAALQQTAEDLRRSNRDLEQFAYIASHDLQEPLRAVGGYVKLLQLRFPDKLDAKAQGYIAGAFDGATRMERLIGDLLAYSRVGTHGGAFLPADLGAALNQALRNLQTGIETARAIVTRDPMPILPVDGTQMMRLFQNLISNALKFQGESPPVIHVGAERQAGRWVFSVRDNGIGIEPQYFEKLFHIFQRLHTRKDYPGTGIGLAICKKIVERHGGTIWVESQPGHSSTFYFSIPDPATHGQPFA